MGNSFLEGGEQNSGTSGIGPLKRGLEEAGLLRPAVAPQSQRSLDSALGQAHTLLQATRNQHRLPGQPEAPLPSVASQTPLKQKIREGSSSSSRTGQSRQPRLLLPRKGHEEEATKQASPLPSPLIYSPSASGDPMAQAHWHCYPWLVLLCGMCTPASPGRQL